PPRHATATPDPVVRYRGRRTHVLDQAEGRGRTARRTRRNPERSTHHHQHQGEQCLTHPFVLTVDRSLSRSATARRTASLSQTWSSPLAGPRRTTRAASTSSPTSSTTWLSGASITT